MHLLSFSRFVTRFRATYSANPGRARAGFVALLAVVVVLMSAKYAAKIAKPGDSGQQTRSAFLRWRELVNGVFDGENIYVGRNEYPNPPIMAVLLRPFMALPPVTGALVWFYTKVLLAVLAAVWSFRLCQPPPLGNRLPSPPYSAGEASAFALDLARAAAVVFCLPALLGDLSHGNVNIFILFLVAAALEAFRRRLDTLAGLTLALAIACKVTPGLFVAYLAWKRCWRALGATLVGLVLWLAVVPGVTFGWDRNGELLTGWYALMVERPLLKGEITTEHPNQAVPGFVYRLFTHSPSFITYLKAPEGDLPAPAEYHNLADIGRPAAWVAVKALTAAFALAVVCLCRVPVRRSGDPRQGWRLAAECGLICLGMLLFSERTWKHHAVVLLLPLAALTYAAAAVALPRRVRGFVTGALVSSFVLMAGPGLLGGRGADLAMVYGTHTIAFVLLTAALCAVLGCRADRARDLRGLNGQSREPIPI
ncbi:MAG TPA: glycosyltransferase family 87 protein [Gemmata sp.]